MMSSHDPNPIFFNNKKIKTGRPEYLLTPHPLHPITSHFCITPPPPPHSPPPTPHHPLPPPQSGRHVCITSYVYMYNNILPQKCKVNVLIFFQKFNTMFFLCLNFNCGQTSSSIKNGLVSIGLVY